MNCKPGDLAIVIKPGEATSSSGAKTIITKGFVGKVVRVTVLKRSEPPFWSIEEQFSFSFELDGKKINGRRLGIADEALLPVSGLPDADDITTDDLIEVAA